MLEIWLPVDEAEFYEVSNLGRVRSVDREFIRADGQRQCRRGRVLTPTRVGRNYLSVTLRFGKRRTVHRMVAIAFLGPRPGEDFIVAHNDGDPSNNRLDNLRWATPSENQQDSIRHGTKYSHPVGSKQADRNPRAQLTWSQVELMRAEYAKGGASERQIAERHGIGKSQAHNILSGKSWQKVAA